jgi:hypothetical protein
MIVPKWKDNEWECPICNLTLLRDWDYCPWCGNKIHWIQAEHNKEW